VVVEMNYGAGCRSSGTAGQTVSGALDVRIVRVNRSANVTFSNLTINGRAISGALAFTIGPNDGVHLTGTTDVTTAQLGRVSGSFTAQLTRTGMITLQTGDVTLTYDGPVDAVRLDGVVMDPVNNGNFVPQAGSAALSIPPEPGAASVPLTISFLSQTPTNGTVQVQMGAQGRRRTRSQACPELRRGGRHRSLFSRPCARSGSGVVVRSRWMRV